VVVIHQEKIQQLFNFSTVGKKKRQVFCTSLLLKMNLGMNLSFRFLVNFLTFPLVQTRISPNVFVAGFLMSLLLPRALVMTMRLSSVFNARSLLGEVRISSI